MKVSFYLKNPDSINRTVIYARLSYKVASFKYYLPESINPKYWNKTTKRAKQSKDFKEYPEFNARMQSFESTINAVYRTYLIENSNDYPSPAQLRTLLDKAIKKIEPEKSTLYTFLGYFENFIQSSKNGKRLKPQTAKRYSASTIQIYNNTYNRIIEFQKWQKKSIDFHDIDMDFYNDFRHYLTEVLNLNPNTIGKDIKTLKTVLNEASDLGYNKNLAFRSKGFFRPSIETSHIYLNQTELNEMINLELSSFPQLDNVRYAFLIACYTGFRYSDFSKLTLDHIKEGYIEIAQSKTENKVVIPVHNQLLKLLESNNWALPKHVSNSPMNTGLKQLGKLMPSLLSTEDISITNGGKTSTIRKFKWELLTTHTARRSFATNNYLLGMPTLTIRAMTGHKSEKTFMRYLRLDGKDHADIAKKYLDLNGN